MGISSQRQHRRMLQQQQHVTDPLLLAQRYQRLLKLKRFRISNTAEMEQMQQHEKIAWNRRKSVEGPG
jgi:hypothetical protein